MTHDLGRLFVTSFRYPDGMLDRPPRAERSRSHEYEPPYRIGKGLAVRLPFSRRAVVVGWWFRSTRDEDRALSEAVSGFRQGWVKRVTAARDDANIH